MRAVLEKVVASTELEPKFDGHKSFYGKAVVNEMNHVILATGECVGDATHVLKSYGTTIAEVGADRRVRISGYADYSRTTLRHLREFLRQYAPACPLDLKFIRAHMRWFWFDPAERQQ